MLSQDCLQGTKCPFAHAMLCLILKIPLCLKCLACAFQYFLTPFTCGAHSLLFLPQLTAHICTRTIVTHIDAHKHTHSCTCARTYNTHAHAHMHTQHICAHIHMTHTCTHIHTRTTIIHTGAHTGAYAHTHTHTHTHTYKYTRAWRWIAFLGVPM